MTHSGHAHRDDFLSVCFTLALCAEYNNEPYVERRNPTENELNDSDVLVLDVGEKHQPELSNFDHHQFNRNDDPACALTLLLKGMGIYEEANLGFRWLNVTEKFDSKGPYFVAKEIGVEWNKISDATFSPIEEAILNRFSKSTKYNPKSDVYIIMRYIGQQLLNTLEQFTERWQKLSETTTTLEVNNNLIVVSVGINKEDDPSFALNAFVEEKYSSAIATVTLDDRGNGYCLFRLNDSPKLDFSQIETDSRILFAHKNGFVAKTHTVLNKQELTEVFQKSLT